MTVYIQTTVVRILEVWNAEMRALIQGCALSQVWRNLSITMWARLVQSKAPGLRISGYVDDRGSHS